MSVAVYGQMLGRRKLPEKTMAVVSRGSTVFRRQLTRGVVTVVGWKETMSSISGISG